MVVYSPGYYIKVDVVGSGGKTNALKGVAFVMTTGKIVGFQEGIMDMTGPGADFTLHSLKQLTCIKM